MRSYLYATLLCIVMSAAAPGKKKPGYESDGSSSSGVIYEQYNENTQKLRQQQAAAAAAERDRSPVSLKHHNFYHVTDIHFYFQLWSDESCCQECPILSDGSMACECSEVYYFHIFNLIYL